MKTHDLIIIGAGAAGLFCAWQAAQWGLRVLILEKNSRPGLKILISGGGRCNFSNRTVSAEDYVSQNPHFCKSALAQFSSEDFIRLVQGHDIAFFEKQRGQLFCRHSAKDILTMLIQGCRAHKVDLQCNCTILSAEKNGQNFIVKSHDQVFSAPRLVLASGGLSFPRLGSSNLGYRLAEQFGHDIISLRPALTPLLLPHAQRKVWTELAGIALPAEWKIGKKIIFDEMLITHQGFSGPAVLRISNYWKKSQNFEVNFLTQSPFSQIIEEAKKLTRTPLTKNILAQHLPKRLAEHFCQQLHCAQDVNNLSHKEITALDKDIHHHVFANCELAGYEKAEVTAGGVDTRAISSQTMESKKVKGLYFIGELLDVTGDLGGFNFQWAWSSAFVAAQAIAQS